MLPGKDVQRQVTVPVVVAVKEPPLLMPVQRIIGGIQIQDYLLRCAPMRIQIDIHPHTLDRIGLRMDLVVAAATCLLMQFQTVQRALARQRRAVTATLRLKLPQQRAEHRVVAQTLVVVEVFIPQRHPKDALPDQRPERQTPPPPGVFQHMKIAAVRRYTVSASGLSCAR